MGNAAFVNHVKDGPARISGAAPSPRRQIRRDSPTRAHAHIVRRICVLALAWLACLALPTPARADFTAFLGVSPTPETRLARGLAIGSGLLVLGWEFEYASLAESETAPGLTTGFGNVLLQTPGLVSPVQVYGTMGAGIFRERFELQQETHVGSTFGGGVKIRVAGPLRLRLDYRLFKLQGNARESKPQRFYAGMNVGF